MRVTIPSATPSPATFTRAGAATYIDESGVLMYSATDQPRYQDGKLLIEGAATNLLLRSQEADNSGAWTRAAGPTYTVTANSDVAPDGATTADTVSMTTGGSSGLFQAVTVTPGTVYTFSWWAKRTADTAVAHRIYNNTAGADVLAVSSYYGAINATTWTRVSVAFTAPVGCTSVRVYPIAGNASLSSGAKIWGMQMEVGPAATSYIPTTTAAASRAADSYSGGYLASYAATSVGFPVQLMPEDPSDLWVSGTAYAVNDLVHRVSTHRVYMRLVAGAGSTAPESDGINWRDIRATQAWAPLVLTEDTKSTAIGNLYFTLSPTSQINALYMGGIGAASVRVVVQTPAGAVTLDQTTAMPAAYVPGSPNNEPGLSVDVSGAFVSGSKVHISLIGAGSGALTVASLRYLAAGLTFDLGGTLQGPRLGITDYSRKVTDEFGTTTFVRRGYAKRLTLELLIPTVEMATTFAILADLRATPALWVPSDTSQLAPLTVYGWCKDFGITVAYANDSLCSIEVEGLL